MKHLTDLDELLQNVRNSYVREYVNEAVTAYRAGAYRAAVATTWVAVCIDIIEKIRELSASGDAKAKVFEDKLNNIQPANITGMLAFENQLLDIACEELELISHIEKKHFERLKEDRNICVHPSFQIEGRHFDISAELARSHFVQSCNMLLVQKPTQGKAVLNLVYDKIDDPTFPMKKEDAYSVLSSERYLGKTKPSVIRNIIIMLLKRILVDTSGMSTDLLARIGAALYSIERLNADVFKDVIKEKLNDFIAKAEDKCFLRLYPNLYMLPQLWDTIEEDQRIRLQERISNMDYDLFLKRYIPTAVEKISSLTSKVTEKVIGLSQAEQKEILKKCPVPAFKEISIDIFIKSGSFNSAYSNGMEILIPHSKYLLTEDVIAILTGAVENAQWHGINQILHAGGIDSVFTALYENTKDNVPTSPDIWSDFIAKRKENGLEFEELEKVLVADGVIDAAEAEVVDGLDDEWDEDE